MVYIHENTALGICGYVRVRACVCGGLSLLEDVEASVF